MAASSSIATVVDDLRAFSATARPGDRMPSSRDLVRRLGVSPVTVSRALAVLAAEGVVTTRPGSGTFVAPPRQTRATKPEDLSWQTISLGGHVVDDSGMRLLADPAPADGINLAGGYPHTSLSASRQLSAAMSRAARRPGAWDAPPLTGLLPLRRWFAEPFGAAVGPDDVVVTSGGQAALSTAMRALAAPGSGVVVESPTYLGALAVARAAGLAVVPVPVDEEGIRPGMLAEAFAATGARVLYCQPTFQNPTGAVMSAERRQQVLAVAAAAGAFVIEDDWARWLSHDGVPPAPMLDHDHEGRVVHIRSLTKTTAASLRVGALVARGPAAARLRALRLVDDLFVAQPLQEAALDFVTSTGWPRHLASLTAALRQRRQAMVSALDGCTPRLRVVGAPRGGFYLWAEVRPALDPVELGARLATSGVHVAGGRPCFAAEPPGTYVRLSYAAPADPRDIEVGVGRLAAALR